MKSSVANPLLPTPLAPSAAPIFSLHAAQMCLAGSRTWQEVPNRLFVQAATQARIVALCGESGSLYETHSYTTASFQVGVHLFTSPADLLAYYSKQAEALTAALAKTGAAQLSTTGEVVAVTPADPTQGFDLNEMCQLTASDDIDIHTFKHGPHVGYSVVFNEDGKGQELPINPLATAYWFQTYLLGSYFPIDVIVGNVLITKSKLID
jgi:hypothetical protein